MECLPFVNDETAYNCATFLMSPECFHKSIETTNPVDVFGDHIKIVSRGLEFGEEN